MFNDIFSAIFLGLVEGLTEFLPVSSTGHLIIAEQYFAIKTIPVSSFLVIIQLGAILAIVFLYWKKLFTNNLKDSKNLWQIIIISTIPAVIFGFLLGDFIDKYLFNPNTVGIGLILGSILLFIADQKTKKFTENKNKTTLKQAFFIGLFQTLALIPGVSRSGASISGAIILGIPKKDAVEYSFFLAIPVIFGASFYSLLKNPEIIKADSLVILITGLVVSFLSAIIAIKFFIKLTEKHSFLWFILYRIVLATIIFLIF